MRTYDSFILNYLKLYSDKHATYAHYIPYIINIIFNQLFIIGSQDTVLKRLNNNTAILYRESSTLFNSFGR